MAELITPFSHGNELYFAKVRPEAVIPSKRDEDAGYDLYACFDERELRIPAHKTVMVPTGIAAAMPPGFYMQIEERGSTGSKGIKKSAGVVDSGYRGEIFVAISNVNDIDLVISKECNKVEEIEGTLFYPYTKGIAQGIIHKVYKMVEYERPYDILKNIGSERGEGKLGSSNK